MVATYSGARLNTEIQLKIEVNVFSELYHLSLFGLIGAVEIK